MTEVGDRFVDSLIAWDNHVCMPLTPFDYSFMSELERYRRSGFSVVSLNIGFAEQSWEDHIAMAQSFQKWLKDHSDSYILITQAKDVVYAKETGRLGVFFDVEGSAVIGGDLKRVQQLYQLGVRWMSLAYNHRNRYAGGCLPGEDSGLSREGFELLDEMQNSGMLVCCSHTGLNTAIEAISYCKNPVIFSHSNCSELWQHPRNIPDNVIELCADKGGVIGVSGVGAFLQKSGADLSNLLQHIDYIAQRVGSEHVGLGLDYVVDQREMISYLESNPDLFAAEDREKKEFPIIGPEKLRFIVNGLTTMGYSKVDIANIVGGNFYHLAERIWKPSAN